MTLTEVGNILFNTLLIGLGVTLWIYLYGLFSMFLRFIWDCYKEYKLRKEMEHRYIESLIEKGLQKEQEELLARDKIREVEFKEDVDKRKGGEVDVDCDN